MRWKKISDAVVRRLPLYLRVLDDLVRNGEVKLISSQELGVKAGVGSALVRKDLAWFGEFGKQGMGYEVEFLHNELRRILNLNTVYRVALVGMGSLGVALARYNLKRYQEDNGYKMQIVALFDNDISKIGTTFEGVDVFAIDKLEEITHDMSIEMAIITVPANAAQIVAERLVAGGVKAILNFAPIKLDLPEHIQVSSADLTLELQRLAYYLLE